MRALIICVVAMLCAACHTNKQATTNTKVVSSTVSVEHQETLIKMLDSLRVSTDIEVSDIAYSVPTVVTVNGKDSVVTSRVEIGNAKRRDNIERVQKQDIENKSESKTNNKIDSETNSTTITDNIVVAEPVSWGWLWWVLIGVGVIVGCWWGGKWLIRWIVNID